MCYFIGSVQYFLAIYNVFLIFREGEFNKDYDRKATFKVRFVSSRTVAVKMAIACEDLMTDLCKHSCCSS